MPQSRPKLRGKKQSRNSIYPVGEFPNTVLHGIAQRIVYLLAVGKADLSGDEWGHCFAESIGGEHHASSVDAQDVSFENCAWSVKTIKSKQPFDCPKIRLISGRNSPSYSHNIDNPFTDIKLTGRAVLEIWNERINRVLSEYEDYRLLVLVRNMNQLQFTMFESEITRFVPDDYRWELNTRRNFQGHDAASDSHCFTWQPHGGQFTIIKPVPASAVKYEIRRPPMLDFNGVLRWVKFNQSWLTVHSA